MLNVPAPIHPLDRLEDQAQMIRECLLDMAVACAVPYPLRPEALHACVSAGLLTSQISTFGTRFALVIKGVMEGR